MSGANDHAAMAATFSDFRIVKTRKVAQFVFEVPLEKADEALAALGGLPPPDGDRWVGVARLDPKAAQRPALPLQGDKPRRDFGSLPYAQQAALKCGDRSFQAFIGAVDEAEAAIKVREECRVTSRSEIESDDYAIARWHGIMADFDKYQRGFR